MGVRKRLSAIGMCAALAVAAPLATVASAAPANAATSARDGGVVMQIKNRSGQLLAKNTKPASARTAKANVLTITCYVDDETPPFRIFSNVAYQSLIGCDGPVISVKYLEVLLRGNSTDSWRTEGTLPGPLTTWTPFDPVVAPCVTDEWVGAIGVAVQFTPDYSLSASFEAPHNIITC